MADSPASYLPEKAISPSSRTAMLRTLAAIAATEASIGLDAFISRLSAALHAAFGKAERADGADICLHAYRHLGKNKATFRRLVSVCLSEALQRELDALDALQTSLLESGAMDLSLVTFEAMEQKVLIDNLSQALERANAPLLGALDARVAHLLQRDDIGFAQNPFRPAVFVNAVVEAWSKFDLGNIAQRVVLRQLQPDVFLQLEPILQAVNDALIANGILPDLAPRAKHSADAPSRGRVDRRSLPLYRKLNRWLPPKKQDMAISPALLNYLDALQQQGPRRPSVDRNAHVPADAAIIREAGKRAPRGLLTRVDERAVELLAKMFDFVFREQHIPGEFKKLLGHLQIPVLKAALADNEFFFRERHPARRLVETVAKAGVGWDEDKGIDDPLYQIAEQVVERVEREYDRQIELFDTAAADLESFLVAEARQSDAALSQAVAQALRQENMERAKELAVNDVAMRLESGEVLGFVEDFLETQWVRVLGLARSMQETKPEVLYKALDAMDDLIWSVKAKSGLQERRELLSRLPALLSILNAWLNVLKWDGPDRVEFFSTLAERHAALVRTQIELSPRQQLAITLDVVQRASERRLNKRAAEQSEADADEFFHLVDGLETGTWIEFMRENGAKGKFRLAWVSPRRSRFIFAGRQGRQAFTLPFAEVARLFRERQAQVVAAEVVFDRAMATVLEELGA